MSKTTPVRWWRDDATRYNARPLVGVCRSWTQPAWAFELPKPLDPETQRLFDALFEASRPERLVEHLAKLTAIPIRELFGMTPVGYGSGAYALAQNRDRSWSDATRTPIEDVKHALQRMRDHPTGPFTGHPQDADLIADMDAAQDRAKAHLDERDDKHRCARSHVRE